MWNDRVRRYGSCGKGQSSPDDIVIKGTKAVHLLAATAWGGGALSMQVLSYIRLTTEDPALAAMAAYCLRCVDTYIVMPGLGMCLLTGLFYSTCTAIGFFKFVWIGFKWFFSLSAGFWGLLFWFPYGNMLIDACAPYGLDWPLLLIRGCLVPENMWQGALQITVVLSLCLISVYRPLHIRRPPPAMPTQGSSPRYAGGFVQGSLRGAAPLMTGGVVYHV